MICSIFREIWFTYFLGTCVGDINKLTKHDTNRVFSVQKKQEASNSIILNVDTVSNVMIFFVNSLKIRNILDLISA